MLRWYGDPGTAATALLLAHGAGAGHDHPWMIKVATGMAARGVPTATFDFPYKAAGRSAPDRGPVLEKAFQDAWLEAASPARGPMFAGGKSMGGRIASQAAALGGLVPPPSGLVFFGYPLHPPGKPDQRGIPLHLPMSSTPWSPGWIARSFTSSKAAITRSRHPSARIRTAPYWTE
jgi:predicted alpha/beta-hydrolase family hydrolase